MRIHEVEPLTVLPGLLAWEGLPAPVRLAWAEADAHRNTPRGAYGPEERDLFEAGLLEETPTGLRRVARGAKALHDVLRAALRCRALAPEGEQDSDALREYVRTTYKQIEREALLAGHCGARADTLGLLTAHVASRTWLQALLAVREPANWEQARLASPWSRDAAWAPLLTPAVHKEVRLLVDEVAAGGGRIRWADLFGGASLSAHRRRAAAVQAALRYLVLFPRLDPETVVLEVGLLPAAAQGLDASPDVTLEVVEVELEPAPPFWILDMVTVLLDAASGEARVKSTGKALYQKTADRLLASLTPLTPQVRRCARIRDEGRLDLALWGVQLLDLMRVDVLPNGRRLLRPAPASRAWLAAAPLERVRTLADHIRGRGPAEESEAWWPHREAALLAPGIQGHDHTLAAVATDDLLAALRAALATLPTKGAVPLDAWLLHQSREQNPLTGTGPAGHAFDGARPAWAWSSPEDRENAWAEILASAIAYRLTPLGGIALGPEGEELRVALTAVGRYLIRATEELELPARTAPPARVLVQPNYDIVFMAPAPDVEALLAPFAERVGHGVGTLFHLSRDAAMRAAAAGLAAEEAVDRLAEAHDGDLPENIARSLRDWFSRVRKTEAARAWVLRCPDEETADRVVAAGGDRVARLGPRTVELDGHDLIARIEKKLEKEGILVERDESVRSSTTRPKRPRRRRRRRW